MVDDGTDGTDDIDRREENSVAMIKKTAHTLRRIIRTVVKPSEIHSTPGGQERLRGI